MTELLSLNMKPLFGATEQVFPPEDCSWDIIQLSLSVHFFYWYLTVQSELIFTLIAVYLISDLSTRQWLQANYLNIIMMLTSHNFLTLHAKANHRASKQCIITVQWLQVLQILELQELQKLALFPLHWREISVEDTVWVCLRLTRGSAAVPYAWQQSCSGKRGVGQSKSSATALRMILLVFKAQSGRLFTTTVNY